MTTKIDKIETNAKRAMIARSEGSIHYVAPAFITPEDAIALVTTIRELLTYADDPNEKHTCSQGPNSDSKPLDCDCFKSRIPAAVTRNLGGDAS